LAATFDADALMRYALYAARLHEALADARAQADAARETSERLRMQARGLLAERDAYRQRLERSMDEVDVEAKRRAARDHDELWLLRGGSAAGGSRQ
jgi:flagellar biosynthesis chaperone FliJ